MADTFKPDSAKTAQDAKAAEDKRAADAKLEADRRQADVDARAVATARTGVNPAISTPHPATDTTYPDHHPPALHRAGVEMRAGMVLTEDQKVAERHGVVQSVEQGVAEMTPHLRRPSAAQVRQDAPQTLEPPVNPKAYAPDSTALAAIKNARQALKDFNYSAADEHLAAAERLVGPEPSRASPLPAGQPSPLSRLTPFKAP